jgi:hypothetical protein
MLNKPMLNDFNKHSIFDILEIEYIAFLLTEKRVIIIEKDSSFERAVTRLA